VIRLLAIGCTAVTVFVALTKGEELLRKLVVLWRSV
jgi:hypothetical protein